MVSKERKAEMLALWWDETNEDWTQEWRDNLNKEERALVEQWDEQYESGFQRICQKILKADNFKKGAENETL